MVLAVDKISGSIQPPPIFLLPTTIDSNLLLDYNNSINSYSILIFLYIKKVFTRRATSRLGNTIEELTWNSAVGVA